MANDASGKVGSSVGQTMSFQGIWLLVGGVGLALVGFTAGRLSLMTVETAPAPEPALFLVQNEDPRELIPLPGPGMQPGEGEGECPIYLYQDGQLYRLMPGGPDGAPPGPEGSPELFPLEPLPRPLPPRQEPDPPERRPGIRA